MPRLGEILVDMRACEPERIREALDTQVLLGGRLGTNLLELGAIGEATLAAALSRRHGTPARHGDIEVEPAAVALLKPEHADRFDAIPCALTARRLSVLCCDPSDLASLDAIAFATGKEVEPIVVPEARLFALLRAHYRLQRPMRGLELPSARRRASPPAAAGPAAAAAPAAEPADLMDEEAFETLYAGVRPAASPPPLPAARPLFSGAAPATPPAATPPPTPSAPPPAASGPSDGAPALEPLTFAEAAAALAGVGDRESVAKIVLRFARSRFRRVVLLAVHGAVAEGWHGLGDGVTPERVARIHLPVGEPGVVQTVVESRAHFLGPLARTDANIALLRALAGGAPRNAFAMPVVARGRVVNVLYADAGRRGFVDASGVGELLILAAKIAQSYDVLLAKAR